MHRLNNNLQNNGCVDSITLLIEHCYEVKLFKRKQDACEENDNFNWYNLNTIILLNNQAERPGGIPFHNCIDGGCVISLLIDEHNTRFVRPDQVHIRPCCENNHDKS